MLNFTLTLPATWKPETTISFLDQQNVIFAWEEQKQPFVSDAFYVGFLTYHYTETSLLNRVGCVVTWVTWIRGLRGSVGVWVTWVKFLRGLRGLRGSKCFLRGSTFYVGHNFYASCVGQIYFCAGQSFLRG